MVHSSSAIEYIEWISADGYDSAKECPRYDTKQTYGETQIML